MVRILYEWAPIVNRYFLWSGFYPGRPTRLHRNALLTQHNMMSSSFNWFWWSELSTNVSSGVCQFNVFNDQITTGWIVDTVSVSIRECHYPMIIENSRRDTTILQPFISIAVSRWRWTFQGNIWTNNTQCVLRSFQLTFLCTCSI